LKWENFIDLLIGKSIFSMMGFKELLLKLQWAFRIVQNSPSCLIEEDGSYPQRCAAISGKKTYRKINFLHDGILRRI
jgi:hypothetical protein